MPLGESMDKSMIISCGMGGFDRAAVVVESEPSLESDEQPLNDGSSFSHILSKQIG